MNPDVYAHADEDVDVDADGDGDVHVDVDACVPRPACSSCHLVSAEEVALFSSGRAGVRVQSRECLCA